MKTIACILFELDEGERVEDLMAKLKGINAKKTVPKDNRPVNWQTKLRGILCKLSVSTNCGGYKSIFYAVKAAHNNPGLHMYEIYEEVGKKTTKNSSTVENELRYFIDNILKYNDYKKVQETLGLRTDINIGIKPAKFIKFLAEAVF